MSNDKSASPPFFFFFLAAAWGGAFLSFSFWSWARVSAWARKPSSRPSGREQGAIECALPEGGAPEIPEIPCAAEHLLGGGGGEALSFGPPP